MIKKIAFVAYPTRDHAAAKKFFGETLGLEMTMDHADMWAEFVTPEGKTIASDAASPKFAPEGQTPVPYLAFEVDDIEAETARLREAGTTVVKEPWINKGADGEEICRMAILLDPDGNGFMLHQIAPDRA